MKCPKCDGELKVEKTIVDTEYIDIDLVCQKDESHRFWCRLHEQVMNICNRGGYKGGKDATNKGDYGCRQAG